MISLSGSFSGPAVPGSIPSSRAIWLGRAMSALVILVLAADGLVQLLAPSLLQANMEGIGFPMSLSPALSLVTLVCTLVYALPRTAVLGAALLTGFLGGAISMHFRLGEIGSVPQMVCFTLGTLAWGGLYLRDADIRRLFI